MTTGSDVVSWQFLLIGGLAAVGAALAAGTLAAMIRYWRTGRFPGTPEDAEPAEITTSQYVGLWGRIVVGVGLAVWGVATMAQQGLL